MDRRDFLLLSLALPGFMSAFSEAGSGQEPPGGRLRGALERARKLGKPLLILVVPEDPGDRERRGRRLAEWLDARDFDLFCDLALCEVAYLRMSELALLDLPEDAGEPLGILTETDDGDSRRPTPLPRQVAGREPGEARRLPWLEQDLHHLLARDRGMLARRRRQVVRTLTTREQRSVARWSGNAKRKRIETAAFADRAAACLLLSDTSPREERSRARWAVRNGAVQRLCYGAAGGARWHREEGVGCGGVPCGTAFCSPRGKVFLSFYATGSPPRGVPARESSR